MDLQLRAPKSSKEQQSEAEAKLLPTLTGNSTVDFIDYEEITRDLKADETSATVAEVI